MPPGTRLTTVAQVLDDGSYLFTASNAFDMNEEVIVVPCQDEGTDVAGWINRCTHEAQRFDTGRGVPMRDGQIVCPKHGSLFDACSGECDTGMASDTTLPGVDVTAVDGAVYLTDDDYEFVHEGGVDGDDGSSSTSHVGW